jgi:hypothetical protein
VGLDIIVGLALSAGLVVSRGSDLVAFDIALRLGGADLVAFDV